jgi:hypothetical protein
MITALTLPAGAQKAQIINLHDAVQHHKVEVINRELTLIDEESYQGIRLSKAFGEGLAWLKGIEFSNGIIEFDVRGEDLKQHSFVGIAFHGQNDSTYDAIYLRPFHFNTQDTILKQRMIQYISLPTYTWRKLRAESPNKYEGSIDPPPDPNAWFHVRIEIKDTTITTYINGSKTPSLVVEKVTPVHSGAIGFYVADTSGGDFANIFYVRQ